MLPEKVQEFEYWVPAFAPTGLERVLSELRPASAKPANTEGSESATGRPAWPGWPSRTILGQGPPMKVNMLEAKNQLSRLVKQALNGEDVVIASNGEPMVRLVPVA